MRHMAVAFSAIHMERPSTSMYISFESTEVILPSVRPSSDLKAKSTMRSIGTSMNISIHTMYG